MTTAVAGTFFDGLTAGSTRVVARRDFETLILVSEDTGSERARWPLADIIEYREEKGTGLLVIGPKDGDARLHIIGGGIIRDARAMLPGLTGAGVPWRMVRKVGYLTAGALGSIALLLFVILPSLSSQLATMIPLDREIAFGKAVRGQIERAFGADEPGNLICEGPEGIDALNRMTVRVLGDAPIDYPLSVVVFDDNLVNAFALPGGHVVIFKGLIDAAETPDEVAAVLAHEIGHVAARDPTRIALQTAGSAGLLGLVLGDFAGGTVALALANQFISASYTQEAEWAADRYAHARMEEAGLPPEALGSMFERLREKHGDVDGFLSYFISHPSLGDRIEAARHAHGPSELGPPSLDDNGWAALKSICDS